MKIRDIPKCAMLAALSVILSQIFIPLGPLPINLALISVFLAGGLLGPVPGLVSQLIYVLIGAAGVPVFSGFSGGFGVIMGPTGGYIIGYILGAGAVGLVIKKAGRSYKAIALALICGWFAVYIPGLLWITRVLEMGFAQALPAFVLPYLPGDIGKMLLSAWLIKRLYPIVK